MHHSQEPLRCPQGHAVVSKAIARIQGQLQVDEALEAEAHQRAAEAKEDLEEARHDEQVYHHLAETERHILEEMEEVL